MDNSTNGETSRSTLISSHSFNITINHLFSTPTHPKPSVLAQQTSRRMKNMVRYSCHIMFLLQCRDHDFVPKGLIIKDPIGSSESSRTLHYVSLTLVKQQLKHFRTCFAKEKNAYNSTMAIGHAEESAGHVSLQQTIRTQHGVLAYIPQQAPEESPTEIL